MLQLFIALSPPACDLNSGAVPPERMPKYLYERSCDVSPKKEQIRANV